LRRQFLEKQKYKIKIVEKPEERRFKEEESQRIIPEDKFNLK